MESLAGLSDFHLVVAALLVVLACDGWHYARLRLEVRAMQRENLRIQREVERISQRQGAPSLLASERSSRT